MNKIVFLSNCIYVSGFFELSNYRFAFIELCFFLLIELSIYRLSILLFWENHRFIDIDPWNLSIDLSIIDLRKNYRVPTSDKYCHCTMSVTSECMLCAYVPPKNTFFPLKVVLLWNFCEYNDAGSCVMHTKPYCGNISPFPVCSHWAPTYVL